MFDRTRLFVTSISLSLLMLGGASFASVTTIGDPNDVPAGRIDIRSASHGHDAKKLRHKVVAYHRFKTSRAPCVMMDTKGDDAPDYAVCGHTGILNLNTIQTSSSLTIRRPNRRTIVYIFSRRAIGRPGSYTWYASEEGEECSNCDRAPNSGRITHNI